LYRLPLNQSRNCNKSTNLYLQSVF
jgi:hypothetical protein